MEGILFFNNYRNIHFIGVGGVSMSGLAKFCLTQGVNVSGSDKTLTNELKRLSSLGAKIYIGHKGKNAENADLVVYSSAIAPNNPEKVYAVRHGIPILKRSEFLGRILSAFRRTVAVAGSHGKTTTTAMIAEALIAANFDPTVFLGGERKTFGNFRSGGGEFAVAEACEYKRNFLDIKPDVAVVLNIDNDHVDTYKDMNDETEAFSRFCKNGLAVINADDVYACRIYNSSTVTFGIKNLAAYSAKYIDKKEMRSFTAYAYGKRLGRITLALSGLHNVYNALAAIAVLNELRVPFKVVKSSIAAFDGVKRRNEYIGAFDGVKCVADYAHHPTEIKALLSDKAEKTLAVFQPHTYSRTAALLGEFASALKEADGVIIYKTYPAREKFSYCGDGKRLFEEISKSYAGDICYAGGSHALYKALKKRAKEYEKILFIGAGDVYSVAKEITGSKKGF
ncbi:MAG: UDP-N-acetylmuramate--L-alanine ligase [Clostridia bacterium]|nr:UDP-N-acetylmuramate--L-alanine ligase [Clostridia bacterium]